VSISTGPTRRWSRSLAQAHAEHDREYGDPADRNYAYPPEIVAAFADSCERSGAHEAGEALSAVAAEMKELAKAINASPVNSIEGLRAKALVHVLGGRSVVRRRH